MNQQLCIASPNLGAYSETFIKDQITQLQPGTLIYHGNYPVKSRDGDWQLPFPLNIHLLKGVCRKLAPDFFHKIFSSSLAKFLKKRGVTTLLANYGPLGVAVTDACLIANVKLVVHYHGYDAYEYATIEKYGEAYRHMFRHAYKLVAVSTEMKDQLIGLGADPGKIAFIPYGINLHRFTVTDPASNPPVLMNIGRFTPKKAPDLLIKAFKIVHETIPEARLEMIGGGELFESTRALAAELGLTEEITFHGVQTSEEIIRRLHYSRMYVQHSLRPISGDSEGTPVSILEACACGLPVVSTRHAGIKDAVLEQVSGLLVNEGDYKGMADAIITLLKDPELCRQMGKAAQKRISDNYNFSIQAAKLAALLDL
ncbi:glycosyltransferase [Chitinophaga polysaccharea]|uniref:glycosyltransferase n=1 Tax=Chitinophaga polysaccharea TaxID=1293035 RepID=UPI0011591A4C|nr:glycosyltransferase [Chitinophaga polysaccharea]